jgi:hypothetical protein
LKDYPSEVIKLNGEYYAPDMSIYSPGEYKNYGRIMNGGIIWHGRKHGYSIHT